MDIKRMKLTDSIKLAIAIVVSELAGIIGSIFTSSSISTWYLTLEKSPLNPPSYVFGPVWTTLFALMGVAAFFIWRKGLERKDVKIALGVFILQLALNTLWSYFFFGSTSLTINGLNNIGIALIEIVVLWIAILLTMILFLKISRLAGWLLFPYILWVSFAIYLNYSIYILN